MNRRRHRGDISPDERAADMLLLLALVVFLLFAGLGFFAHVLWLGLIASMVLLVVHMWRHGLTRDTPTSRLNVRLVAALRGFLDDVLASRSRERQLKDQPRGPRVDVDVAPTELAVGSDDILDADIVEDDAETATAKERAARWRAMTPAKLAEAEQMAAAGASRAEIARRLKVSRSTVSRHLAGNS